MSWPAIGVYYVGATGSCLFNHVSFVSFSITLTAFVQGVDRWGTGGRDPPFFSQKEMSTTFFSSEFFCTGI